MIVSSAAGLNFSEVTKSNGGNRRILSKFQTFFNNKALNCNSLNIYNYISSIRLDIICIGN